MSVDNDNREPIEVLYNIEDKVSQLDTDNTSLPDEPRFVPSKEHGAYEALSILKDGGKFTSTQLDETVSKQKVSRILSDLWKSYLVDRSESNTRTGGQYIYQINDLGNRALEIVEEHGKEPEQSQLTKEKEPWEDLDISRSMYYAMQAIDEQSDTPRAKDIDKRFLELSGLDEHTSVGPTVGPYLSKLAKNTEYVDRTPVQPYRYWVTEKGKEILE